jgi:hypothetical protein
LLDSCGPAAWVTVAAGGVSGVALGLSGAITKVKVRGASVGLGGMVTDSSG